jgi:hypothetical protein
MWMRSHSGRNNILSPKWEKVGIGVCKGDDDWHYWCAEFATEWHDLIPLLNPIDEEEAFAYPSEPPALPLPDWALGVIKIPFEGSFDLNLIEVCYVISEETPSGIPMNKKKLTPTFDALGNRELMAASVFSGLAGGVLAVVGTNQADSIRISNPTPTTIELDVKGQASKVWATSAVKAIAITSLNGDDSIINLTQTPSVIVAGNGNNYINSGDPSRLGTGGNDVIRVGNGNNVIQDSGGTDVISSGNGDNVVYAYGKDQIIAGNGDNVLYNIVGSGNIVAGNGQNRVITNNNFKVNVGQNSLPTYIFGGRTAPVTLDANGILNFQAATGNTNVTIDDNYDGTITSTYTNDATGVTDVETFQKSQVTGIGAIFGKGTGTFTNNTDIDDVVYGGGAGGNTLIGGQGFNFMKSNSAGDTIIGGDGGRNVLSEGGMNGTIIGGNNNRNVLVAGFSGTTTVLSVGDNDVVTGDTGPGSLFAGRKTKFYN